MSKQSAGGKATAVKLRNAALLEYAQNPNICTYCLVPIPVREGQKVCDVRKKKFCDRRCAALHNNTKFPKRKVQGTCKVCNHPISTKKTWCSSKCREKSTVSSILSETKGSLFARRANWQSARSTIGKLARAAYHSYIPNPSCEECGYTLHIEVCHRRDVSDFPDDALISEINSRENLVGLCPTHHWEFDNGILILNPHESESTL